MHGFDCKNRYRAVSAADMPTVLVIQDSGGHVRTQNIMALHLVLCSYLPSTLFAQVFGAFINSWQGGVKEGIPNGEFFGSGECFLFQVRALQ